MANIGAPCKLKTIVFFCMCLFVLPAIQATYFQPCYYNVDYSVKIDRVNVFSDPTIRQQDVSIRYKARSDVHIPKRRVRVDTFLTYESSIQGQDVEYSNSHPFCKDTECPIEWGDTFNAEFSQNIPWNAYGSMTLLMRLVDKFNGRELACVVINFSTYYDRVTSESN